jgi:hypothetical protein
MIEQRPYKILAFGNYFFYLDHVTLWVANAKQAASYYTARFGF